MKRIPELDLMKGIATLLVVMGHVVLFSLKLEDSAIVGLIAIFHMPIFFTVSGFLSYKPAPAYKLGEEAKRLFVRSRTLLVPLVAWSLLSYLLPDFPVGGTSVFYRNGYWFFLALWWCNVILFLLSYVVSQSRKLALDVFLFLATFALIVAGRLCNFDLFGYFPIMSIQYYFPFFAIGFLMRKYASIQAFLLNKYTYALGIAVVLLGWYFRGMQNYGLFALSALFAVIVAWLACREINPENRTSRVLSVIGQNTLPIYAIHYFFIAGLPVSFHEFVNVPMGFVFQFVIAFVYAVVIVGMCLVVDRILSVNPITRMLFFGESKKRCW